MLFVLTGNGKGKTTSSIGMAIRAVGAGKKVLMISFLKVSSSEDKIIKKIRNFEIKKFGKRGFYLPKKYLEKRPELKKFGVKPADEKIIKILEKGFNFFEKVVKSKKYQMIILDEICPVLNYGFLEKKKVLKVLLENKNKIDIVLTGRNCPKEFVKEADLVTDFREVKHYFRKGIECRKGIEF